MRQGQQQNRRGRNRGGGGGSGGGRKPQNSASRNYESSGPDVKIRGTASHIAEKYASLARDAMSAGDIVAAENYLQHAEHYNRIIMANQVQNGGQAGIEGVNGMNGGGRYSPQDPFNRDDDDDGQDDVDGDDFAPPLPRRPQFRDNQQTHQSHQSRHYNQHQQPQPYIPQPQPYVQPPLPQPAPNGHTPLPQQQNAGPAETMPQDGADRMPRRRRRRPPIGDSLRGEQGPVRNSLNHDAAAAPNGVHPAGNGSPDDKSS